MNVRPHARNTSFEWSPPPGPYRRITAEQARSWDQNGYFLLENALDRPTVERVIAEIDPWEAKVEAALREQGGKRFIARADEITFTVHLVLRSQFLRELCAGPVFQDLGHDLLGPDVRLYWDQAVYKKPGTEAPFPWHQDNGYNFVEPQCYLTCWIALTDATEQSGCPWVVPGLHRLGTLEHWTTPLGYRCLEENPPGAVPVEALAGSIVVFTSLTPHATGANRTAGPRKAYIVQLALDGTCQVRSNPDTGAIEKLAQNDPARQFLITGPTTTTASAGPSA
jgi:ectoine hydroxylase-related dioxygenase (phytanoyl-CoA dioxygenase family)